MKKLNSKLLSSIFIFILVVVNTLGGEIAKAEDSQPDSNILILNSYHKGLAWTDDVTDGIVSTLKGSGKTINISVEYMDWKRYSSTANLDNLYNSIKLKYSNKKLDLVLTADDAALEFALKHRSELFPDSPIVFSGINSPKLVRTASSEPNLTGIIEQIDAENTIKIALKLNPSLKTVYIIYDNSESGTTIGLQSIREIKAVDNSINVIPFNNMLSNNILMEAANLSNNSILLMTSYFSDSDGTPIDTNEFSKLLSEKVSVPLYHLYDFSLNNGSFGGSMASGRLEGEYAAEMALRILEGETASSIPISREKITRKVIDYSQLDKFNIASSRIPKDIEQINKPFSFFESYRTLVYSSAGTFIILVIFITVLLLYINKIRNMKRQLEDSHEELTQLYEELTATDEEIRAQYEELCITQSSLVDSEERYKSILEASNDGIWDEDLKTGKIFLSSKWHEMFNYTDYADVDTSAFWFKLVHPEDINILIDARNYHVQNKTPNYECDFRLKFSNDEYKWIHARGIAHFDPDGTPSKIFGSLRDVTELKEYESELQYVAYHDPLTGLSNRLGLYEKVGLYLLQMKNDNTKDAMLFIDTDNFKLVNDTMGHSFGDKLLIDVAMRLLSFTDNSCQLFRLGGDEFIFYIKDVKSKDYIEDFASKITKAFGEPFNIEGNMISSSISIGISMFPEDGKDVDSLLRCADLAMYKVKEQGKNGYYFFNSLINDEIFKRVNIEKYFKKALSNNEFLVYYQPQINVKTKKVDAFEALIRWQSPELGMVSPLSFINIAEETGFIIPLGQWILYTACKFIEDLNKARSTEYKISVNISVIQLLQDNFTAMIEKVLSDTGLPPSLLELEITESIIMESPELIIGKLKALREKGISIALDDFGTGYSSLAYLRKIPITTLKIDKLFIDDIASARCSTSLTDSIIALGHKIGLVIVAEGVEENHQLEYLENNHCDKIQGYLFSKPLPASEIDKALV